LNVDVVQRLGSLGVRYHLHSLVSHDERGREGQTALGSDVVDAEMADGKSVREKQL
jgi:hypothetical protein